MKRVTVLGASGFIGSHLAAELRRRGLDVWAPPRDAEPRGADLGTAFFCIGLTADTRSRPFDTVEAHVGKLAEVLRGCSFDRLVYLSTTRLYLGAERTDEEAPLRIDPRDDAALYNLSKATGEALALASGRPVRIARLSNVYGPDFAGPTFLAGIVRDAVTRGRVVLRTAAESAKDYLHIRDAVESLVGVGLRGTQPVYNLASGRNVSHAELLARLRELTGCETAIEPSAPRVGFAPIDVSRLRAEFPFVPIHLPDELPRLVARCRAERARTPDAA